MLGRPAGGPWAAVVAYSESRSTQFVRRARLAFIVRPRSDELRVRPVETEVRAVFDEHDDPTLRRPRHRRSTRLAFIIISVDRGHRPAEHRLLIVANRLDRSGRARIGSRALSTLLLSFALSSQFLRTLALRADVVKPSRGFGLGHVVDKNSETRPSVRRSARRIRNPDEVARTPWHRSSSSLNRSPTVLGAGGRLNPTKRQRSGLMRSRSQRSTLTSREGHTAGTRGSSCL
jgi:hypothetical protein